MLICKDRELQWVSRLEWVGGGGKNNRSIPTFCNRGWGRGENCCMLKVSPGSGGMPKRHCRGTKKMLGKKSEMRTTASVLKQDLNTYKVQKNAIIKTKHNMQIYSDKTQHADIFRQNTTCE